MSNIRDKSSDIEIINIITQYKILKFPYSILIDNNFSEDEFVKDETIINDKLYKSLLTENKVIDLSKFKYVLFFLAQLTFISEDKLQPTSYDIKICYDC